MCDNTLCNGFWGHQCATNSIMHVFMSYYEASRQEGPWTTFVRKSEDLLFLWDTLLRAFMGIRSSYSDSKGRKGERIRSSFCSNLANFYTADIPSVSRTTYQVSCWTFFLVLVLQNIFKAIVGIYRQMGHIYLHGSCYL
jgi:hypothetical protein